MKTRKYDRLRLDSEGNWFCADGEITHPRTMQLFSRSIKKTPAGGYQLVIGKESCPIEVEDTPFMVRRVDFSPDRIFLTLNDDTEEILDLSSLKIGENHILYCRVKGGEFPARFLRKAYYQLADRVEYNQKWGYYLVINREIFPLQQGRKMSEIHHHRIKNLDSRF